MQKYTLDFKYLLNAVKISIYIFLFYLNFSYPNDRLLFESIFTR